MSLKFCVYGNLGGIIAVFFFFDTAAPQMAQSRSKIGDYKGDNGGLICRDSKLWARFDTEFCQRVVSLCNFYQYESEREL